MRRFVLPGLVVGAAVGLLALLTFGVTHQAVTSSIDARVQAADRQGPRPGAFPQAPSANLALPLLGSDHTASLAEFRGKVVILNVFASWCDPCRAEAPILADAERRLIKDNATVLGVTYLDNPIASAQFVRQEHITYPVLRDVSGDFVRSFGTTGVPETFVINRQGQIQALRRYQLNDTWLSRTLPRILAQRS
jgi:cytochrome c biogenesis protein CcmG, thiol:disulfide interchange protein DsbE